MLILAIIVSVAVFQSVFTSGERERSAAASTPPSAAASSTPPSTGPSSPPSIEGVTVPDVIGLSPMEAGALLTGMGLSVVDAEPAPGPPGTVVGTDPAVDEVVDPATPIVLLVGAPPDRMVDSN